MRTILLRRLLAFVAGLLFSAQTCLAAEPVRSGSKVQKRIVMIIGENEYSTWETLPEFARVELVPRSYQVSPVLASPKEGDSDFQNFETIRDADLVVVSVRRRTPPKAMMELLRAHVAAGKPIVGIRTASHAFEATPASPEFAAWNGFDLEVLGGHYEGHYNNKPPAAPHSLIEIVRSNASHAVLTGVASTPFRVTSHLYKNRRLAPTVVPLLQGQVEGLGIMEPVAWVNTAQDRRVFYTSLGNVDDFKLPAFRRLLLNGILWCLRDPVPPVTDPAATPATKARRRVVEGEADAALPEFRK